MSASLEMADLSKTLLDIMLERMLLIVLIIFAIVELTHKNLVYSANKISDRISNAHKFAGKGVRIS